MEDTAKQYDKQPRYDWLKQYQFQKGQSGNPNGRPPGKSLKTFARELLENMNEGEKAKFMKKLPPDLVWKMAEGNPKNDVEVTGELTSKIISVDE